MIARPAMPRILLLCALSLALAAGLAGACTPVRHLLTTADPLAMGPQARPPLFENLPAAGPARRAAWARERAVLLDQLEATLYGRPPPDPEIRSLSPWRTIAASQAPGRRAVSRVEITPAGGAALDLQLALVTPETGAPVRGLVLVPSECGLQAALHDPAMPAPDGYTPGYCDAEGWLAALIGPVFGEWISGPPVARLLDRGYAVAAWHESDIAPDSAALHDDSLRELGLDPDAPDRPGAVALWAWTLSAVIDALRAEPRFAEVPVIAYGHSRRGKAVLLAAARDARIAITLAHQSGTGGAALHGDGVGESVAAITDSYPHWFAPRYADYAGREDALPIDQHALLALIAPRAVLLGGAWRDTWSDPAGAFRAAEAASKAWTIYDAPGLIQTRLTDFQPGGGIAHHIRPGLHGVTDADWDAFLDFMDAHTAPPERP